MQTYLTSSNKAIAANTFITKFSYHDRVLSKNEIKDLNLKLIIISITFQLKRKIFSRKKRASKRLIKKLI
jgi:hypothetical protein